MYIIGITGGTASGKTTLVSNLEASFSKDEICVISQDAYYKRTDEIPLEDRALINFDHPDAIDFELLAAQLLELKKGNTIERPNYSFITHNRTNEITIVNPKKIIIVEGILVLSHELMLNLFDLKIFVDTDADERLIRRLLRDTKERGRDVNEVINRYRDTLKPMHDLFIEPTKKLANIIIPADNKNTEALGLLVQFVKQKIL
ncbi:MAG: uridine kinase [Flavicella sp.]